jgi:hypothetical protein
MEANLKKRIGEVIPVADVGWQVWMEGASENLQKLLGKLDTNGDGVLDGSELKQVETLHGGLSEDCTGDFGGRRARGYYNPAGRDSYAEGLAPWPPDARKVSRPPLSPPAARVLQERAASPLIGEVDALSGRSLASNAVFPAYRLPKSYANEAGIAGRIHSDRVQRSSRPYVNGRYSERQRAVQDERHAQHRRAALHASPRQVEAKARVRQLTEELADLTPRFYDKINPPPGKRIGMKSDARGVEIPRREDKRCFLQASDLHGMVRGLCLLIRISARRSSQLLVLVRSHSFAASMCVRADDRCLVAW